MEAESVDLPVRSVPVIPGLTEADPASWQVVSDLFISADATFTKKD